MILFNSQKLEAQELRSIPFLSRSPAIDGNLDDWKQNAFSDGTWDLARVQSSPWYEPARNRLTVESTEDTNEVDLSANYYLAHDGIFLYFGVEVEDNVNDIMDKKHEPKRWYYKDAVALFIEFPRDSISEKFGAGDHGLAFVADSTLPGYAAWWRHGTADSQYIEEPLPETAYNYSLKMDPHSNSGSDYVMEVCLSFEAIFGAKPTLPATISLMIVHCDPDGGEYGGHLLIYGKGDDDASWSPFLLSASTDDRE